MILAAGLSTRMGRNKLLEDIGGKAMVRRVVEAALASRARPVIVVVGDEAEAVRGALAGLELQTIENSDYREGLGASIRAGIASIPVSSDGVLILMADMPRMSTCLIDRAIAAAMPGGASTICVASHGGRRGHPVLFGRSYFPELLALAGDVGARNVIARNEAHVCEFEAGDDAPLEDIDTPAALAKFRASLA